MLTRLRKIHSQAKPPAHMTKLLISSVAQAVPPAVYVIVKKFFRSLLRPSGSA
jgi:hypothetical protein